jgi:hypothetical protein
MRFLAGLIIANNQSQRWLQEMEIRERTVRRRPR